MSIELITVAMIGTLLLLLVIGMPMALALGFVAVAFAFAFFGWNALQLISSRIYGFVGVYVLLAVPMFLLMAAIMDRSGVARDLYDAMSIWAGGLPGGVAVMTLIAAVFMAATTGIIGGEIILLGLVALPQMLRLGYQKNLAIGTICAGGSLGTMIPPSIVLIFYGLTANVSIGILFVAVIMPGLLLASIYLVYTLIRCWLDPSLAPPVPYEERNIPLVEKLALLKGLFLPIMIIVWVLGSIYGGIASVTESAGIGVVGAIASAWLRKELTWALMRKALLQTMTTVGVLLWLAFGANALIGIYNIMGGTGYLRDLISGLPLEPLGIIVVMMLILLVLGCFMDWIGILLLTMPIFVPVAVELGYDPVWFGILFCMNMQASYLSPPFGPAAFYLKSVAPPEISMQTIFTGVLPFIGLQVIGLLLVLLFPQVALWPLG